MSSRIELQGKLEEILGSKNVYYEPPESKKMEYPCIKYSRTRIDTKKADDSIYKVTKGYDLIVISKKPDNDVIDKLLVMPMCNYDRHYVADGLHHDSFTLYY